MVFAQLAPLPLWQWAAGRGVGGTIVGGVLARVCCCGFSCAAVLCFALVTGRDVQCVAIGIGTVRLDDSGSEKKNEAGNQEDLYSLPEQHHGTVQGRARHCS